MNTDATVKVILATQLGINEEQVRADQSLERDLGLDSLDIVEIWMAIEDELNVAVPDEEAYKAKTVGEVIALVQSRVPA